MVTNMQREERKPLLSLETAVPDPKVVEIDGEKYDMRPVASYSTRERKILQTYLAAIVEYEMSPEENVDPEDEDTYKQTLRKAVDMAMPSLPEHVHSKLTYMHHGMIVGEVIKLFRERNGASDDVAVPEPEERVTQPKLLRKLREKLNSPTPLHPSPASTEADLVSG